MQFVYYLAGESRNGKLVSVGLGLSNDPEAAVIDLDGTMPFSVRLMAVEKGTPERLEQVKELFKANLLHGFWYKPTPELVAHVEGVERVDPSIGRTVRVSLDLTPEDFAYLEGLVGEMGHKNKARLLRKALKFYGAFWRYKAQGYMIQAVKGGKMIQFPNLDTVG